MYALLALAAVTVAPVVAVLTYVYVKDIYKSEPTRPLIICFILGMLSTIPAAFAETVFMPYTEGFDFYTGNAINAFIIIGISEELVKFIILSLYAARQSSFDEPFDGIVYSVFISMGFAFLENIFYVMEGGMRVAVLRMFTAVPAHATFAVLMGHFYGLSAMRRYSSLLKYLGLLIAILFHGAYDYFIMISNNSLIILGAFVSLYLGVRYAYKAIRIHQEMVLRNENHFR
jgi:RsiW-degrading membrane proteinase PrsW (M82 family)